MTVDNQPNRAGAADHEPAPGTRRSRKAKGSADGDGSARRGGRHAASASVSEAVDELCELIIPLVEEMQEQTRRMNREAEAAYAEVDELTAPLCFAKVDRWVNEFFLPLFSWRVDGRRWLWCPQWWKHVEAIWRLELLWRSWETARRYPTGMSSWSTELDAHLELLLGEQGPFRLCQAECKRVAQHVDPEPVTAEPAPADWWPTA